MFDTNHYSTLRRIKTFVIKKSSYQQIYATNKGKNKCIHPNRKRLDEQKPSKQGAEFGLKRQGKR